jgi:hypothetical protein
MGGLKELMGKILTETETHEKNKRNGRAAGATGEEV